MSVPLEKVLLVFIFIFIVYVFYRYLYDGTVYHKSNVDGKYYRIRRGPDSQIRADNLALINLKLKIIVNSLNNSEYSTYENVIRLVNKWNSGIDIKEIGMMESDAAYVLNKHKMSFCLRSSPSGGNIESLNLLTYVAIHELAHVMSIEVGHSTEFKSNFKFLLNFSKGLEYTNPLTGVTEKLYVSIDPVNNNEDSNFCGVEITAGSIK